MQYNANLIPDVLGKRRFADFVADTLERFQVDTIFGMPAESLTPLVDAVRRGGRLRFISVRHEGAGALMASAYAKLTGRLAMVAGTGGPGVTHLPIGTYDARADDAPLLAWCGQVPLHHVGAGGFQEVTAGILMADSVCQARVISSEQQTTAFALACADALQYQGVSLVEASNDVLTRPVAPDVAVRMDPRLMVATPELDAHALDEAARRLAQSRGEIVVLVGAVDGRGQPAVERLARWLKAPVVVVPEGYSYLSAEPSVCTLRCTSACQRDIQALLDDAAHLVVVGPLRPFMRSLLPSGADIIQFSPGEEASKPLVGGTIRLYGAIDDAVAQLVARTPERDDSASLQQGRALATRHERTPSALWAQMDEALPDDAVLALEPGPILDAAFAHLPVRRRIVTSSFNHGARGYALPAAIAATLAYPQRKAIGFTSAEGFAESMAELLTARKYNLAPVIVCFLHDHGDSIDFIKYAGSAGAFAALIDDRPESLSEALAAALAGDRAAVLVVKVSTRPVAHIESSENVPALPVTIVDAPGEDERSTFAHWLVEALVRAGVDRVYGRMRSSIRALVDAIDEHERLEFFDVMHAESAAMMASAHSKWTDRIGVCISADHQDLLFSLNGLYDASLDHNPLLILSQTAIANSVDPIRLLEGVATTRVVVAPDQAAPRRLAEALSECSRKRDVVHVAVDWTRLTAPMDPVPDWFHPVCAPEVFLPPTHVLQEAADRLVAADRPALLVGRGGVGATDEIVALSELLQAPIVTTLPGLAAVPTDHPNMVGCNGSSGHRAAVETLEQCDVLLILGSSNRGAIFGMVGRFFIVQIDRDPSQLGRREFGTLPMRGSVKETVRRLHDMVSERAANGALARGLGPSVLQRAADLSGFNRLTAGLSSHRIDKLEDGVLKRALAILVDTPPGEALQALMRRARGTDRGPLLTNQRERFERWREIDQHQHQNSVHDPIAPPAICRVLQRVLDDRGERAIATVDVGVMTLWVLRHFEGGGHDIVWTASFASMGFAMPAAIAIAAMERTRPVIAFVGDGGIAITMAELANAVARDLPIVVVVFNNGKLAAVKFELEVMGWPEFEAGLFNCDFAQFAESCGAKGIRVTKADQLESAMHDALSCGRPCVVDVVCDGDYMPAPPKVHISQGFGYGVALLREAKIAAETRLRALRAGDSSHQQGMSRHSSDEKS